MALFQYTKHAFKNDTRKRQTYFKLLIVYPWGNMGKSTPDHPATMGNEGQVLLSEFSAAERILGQSMC